jgi:hypothetical protein
MALNFEFDLQITSRAFSSVYCGVASSAALSRIILVCELPPLAD